MDDLSTDELILEFDLARIFFAEEEEEEEASYVVSLKDITERKRADRLVHIQHDLALALSNTSRLEEGLSLCLQVALSVAGMDCGGFYLVDKTSGALDLVFHQGLSSDFAIAVAHYAADSANAKLVMAGKPVYTEHLGLEVPLTDAERRESLRAIAVVPVSHEGRVIGCLNVASHALGEVPAFARDALETVVAQTGNAIARLQAEEALKESEEKFGNIFKNDGIGKSVTLLDGTMNMNPAFCQMLGYTLAELTHEKWQNITHPDDIELSENQLKQLRSGEKESVRFIKRYLKKDGSIIWADTNVVLQKGGGGKPLYYITSLMDITERKRAEEALRMEKENFRHSLDESPLGVRIVTADGDTLYANRAILDLYGYDSLEELQNTPLKDRYTPESYAEFLERKQQRQHGDFSTLEYGISIVRKNGEVLHLQVHRKDVLWNNAQQFLVMYQDVTERKRAAEALAESERKLKTLFEILPVGVSVLDTERKIVYVNPALGRILDLSIEDLLRGNHETRTYLRPDGTLMPAEEFASIRAVKEQRAVHNVETGVVREDSKVVWTSVSAVPLGFPDWEVLVVTSDITERKRAEGALHVSLEKYRVLFESFPLGITISDKSGKIIEVNRQSERLLGITRDAHAQRRINSKEWQIVRKDGTPMPVDEFASTRALQENRLIENVEMGIVKDKGEITWINVIAAPIPLEGYGVAIAYGDITDRKLAEERLKTTQEQLHLLAGHLQSVREEERKHLSQEFHDQLGQVLTALKMDLSMLHRTLADPGRELSRTAMALGVESMQGMIDRAIGIIREILSELRPEMLDQLGIVPTLEWEAERFQRHSGISCTFNSTVEDIGLDTKKSIALYRILQEAVTNVARHAKATSVEVTLRKEGDDLILEIKDNGIGISADAEQKTRSFGLIGMRERAILLGGTLEIRGVEGQGTTVLVRIPYE